MRKVILSFILLPLVLTFLSGCEEGGEEGQGLAFELLFHLLENHSDDNQQQYRYISPPQNFEQPTTIFGHLRDSSQKAWENHSSNNTTVQVQSSNNIARPDINKIKNDLIGKFLQKAPWKFYRLEEFKNFTIINTNQYSNSLIYTINMDLVDYNNKDEFHSVATLTYVLDNYYSEWSFQNIIANQYYKTKSGIINKNSPDNTQYYSNTQTKNIYSNGINSNKKMNIQIKPGKIYLYSLLPLSGPINVSIDNRNIGQLKGHFNAAPSYGVKGTISTELTEGNHIIDLYYQGQSRPFKSMKKHIENNICEGILIN